LGSVFLAVIGAPWFKWSENALSDLGARGHAVTLFNSGIIIGGSMMAIFAINLIGSVRHSILARLGALLVVFDAFLLCAIGVFPETSGPIHYYVSFAFFTLLPVALLIIGTAAIQHPSTRRLGLFTLILGLIASLAWTFPTRGAAIPEMISSLAGSLWLILISIRLSTSRTMSLI
jgi:hypothetical membrane protein